MYQALYRKYRPRTFDEVAGQEHVTETLKKQIASGRLSHAYLFIGTRGTGKTTCAKILAKAVNCEHPMNGNPCGQCPACRGIDDGSVLDVVEIDAASNNSVDSVRALRDEAVFTPASVKKRVYIIDEVHMLSTAAFNALLKIIEEPPEHLMFILATTELRKVPATILSRCQRYSFRRISVPVLSERLNYIAKKEGLNLVPEASLLLSRLADGSFRDGISLLDQCSGASVIDADAVLSALGLAGGLRTAELLSAISARDTQRALSVFSALWNDGKEPSSLLSDLCVLMRDLLILSVAPNGGLELLSGAFDLETLRGFSRRFTDAELLRSMARVQETLSVIRDNPSPRTAAELCLVTLCDPCLSDGLPELMARISRLEAGGLPAPTHKDEPPREAPRREAPAIEAPVTEAPAMEAEVFIPEPPEEEYPPMPEQEFEPYAPEPERDFAPAEEPTPAPAAPTTDGASWSALASAMKPRLPIGLQSLLDDPLQIYGEFTEDALLLRIASGFASNMLNKPDIISGFRELAEGLSGRKLAFSLLEMDSAEKIEKRSIDELAKFKGVTFK
ncbi:MAG: DNA polymerase III subunit gamma/tau [Oscillospiraceae bacterium]